MLAYPARRDESYLKPGVIMRLDTTVAWGLLWILLALLPTLSIFVGGVPLRSVDVVLIPLAVLVAILVALHPATCEIPFQLTDACIIFLLVSVALSCITSFKPELSQILFWDWIRITISYFIARVTFRSPQAQDLFPIFLKIVATILLTVGILQILTESQVGLIGNLVGENRDQHVGLRINMQEVAVRVSGTTSNPNIYGQWVILFCGYWLLELAWRKRYVWFSVLSAASLWVLLRTFSRGVLATFLMTVSMFVLLMAVKRPMSVRRLGALAMVFLLGGILLVGTVALGQQEVFPKTIGLFTKRFEVNNDSARINMIQEGWQFLDSPKKWFLGLGPGSFHSYAYAQGLNLGPRPWHDYSSSTSGIHNVSLKLLVEYGSLTLLSFLLAVLGVLLHLCALLRSSAENHVLWSIYGLSVLAGFALIASQVYESTIYYQVMIPTALLAAYIQSQGNEPACI